VIDSLDPGRLPPSPPPLPGARISRLTKAGFILSILGAIGCFPLGIVGLILGIVALSKINRHSAEFGGKGHALVAIAVGACSILITPCLLAAFVPVIASSGELANRAHCAANITAVLKACVVYAQENSNCFPMTTAEKSGYNVYFGTADAGTSVVEDALKRLQTSTKSQGNPVSCLWILCVQGNVSPDSLQCSSDPYAHASASPLQNGGNGNNFFYAPTSPYECSYSIAAPWVTGPDGITMPSGVWRNRGNASIPLMCDMAPVNGTGGRDFSSVNASRPKALNSNNHSGGEGQNIGMGDCSAEWHPNPVMGPGFDFIFTHNRTASGTTWTGTQSTGTTPIAPADSLNDVQMIPARNLDNHTVQ